MAHASGNPTWQDFPDVSTLVTALGLEQIESLLDTLSAAADRPFARYHCNVGNGVPANGQNILADGSPKMIPYDLAVETHADVTRAANFLNFTLNRAGVWRLTAGIRNQITVAARHQFMIWDGSASVNRYVETASESGTLTSWNISTERRFAQGAVVAAGMAILTTGVSDKIATDVPGSTFFALSWIRP